MNRRPRQRRPEPRRMGSDAGAANRVPIIAAVALIGLIVGIGIVGSGAGSSSSAGSTSVGSTAPSEPSPSVDTTPDTVSAPSSSAPAPSSTAAAPTAPPLSRTLARGMQGDDVLMVQERLAELAFDPGPADGIYGSLTEQAVWAFEKLVMKTPREQATGQITAEAWETLGNPLRIAPRRSTNGQADHSEVYLTEQVMIVFHNDVPAIITHISSGQLDENGDPKEYCERATYDTDQFGVELEEPVTKDVCALAKTPGGVFTYDRQVEGKRVSPLGGMWNPVYFNYGIAVHGAREVPLQPASHGCVRMPMHISEYFQSMVSLGDQIFVWNGKQEPEQVSDRGRLPSFDYADPSATTTTTSTTTTTTIPTTTVPPETTTTTTIPQATTTSSTTSTSSTSSTTSTSPSPPTTTTTVAPQSTAPAPTAAPITIIG